MIHVRSMAKSFGANCSKVALAESARATERAISTRTNAKQRARVRVPSSLRRRCRRRPRPWPSQRG
eukprot:3187987-Lingulodinium_polyedra.AAC.1